MCAQTFQLAPRSGFQVPGLLGSPFPPQPLPIKPSSQAFCFAWPLVSALNGSKQPVSTLTVSQAMLAAVRDILVHRDTLPHSEMRMLSCGDGVTLFAAI